MHKVSLIMDDGPFDTRIMNDKTLDELIRRFRIQMSKKCEVKFQNGEIMALDGDKFVMSMEWREAMSA